VTGAWGWQPHHIYVPNVTKSGSLKLLELSGPHRACYGTALPLLLTQAVRQLLSSSSSSEIFNADWRFLIVLLQINLKFLPFCIYSLTFILLTWKIWWASNNASRWYMGFSPLNAELNPICHLLALLGSANIVVVSRLRVNSAFKGLKPRVSNDHLF
jgi:hypothetical protein